MTESAYNFDITNICQLLSQLRIGSIKFVGDEFMQQLYNIAAKHLEDAREALYDKAKQCETMNIITTMTMNQTVTQSSSVICGKPAAPPCISRLPMDLRAHVPKMTAVMIVPLKALLLVASHVKIPKTDHMLWTRRVRRLNIN